MGISAKLQDPGTEVPPCSVQLPSAESYKDTQYMLQGAGVDRIVYEWTLKPRPSKAVRLRSSNRLTGAGAPPAPSLPPSHFTFTPFYQVLCPPTPPSICTCTCTPRHCFCFQFCVVHVFVIFMFTGISLQPPLRVICRSPPSEPPVSQLSRLCVLTGTHQYGQDKTRSAGPVTKQQVEATRNFETGQP